MPVKIFFCYAHEDEPLLRQLKSHLIPLKRQGLIDFWYDRDISAGTEWEQEISQHLNSAQIILLLVSPDFMASDYINNVELKRALERHDSGEARVIPLILRHVYWQEEPLGKLQALPTDGKPVQSSSWYNLDEAFLDIVKGISKAVEKLTTKSSSNSQEIPVPTTQLAASESHQDKPSDTVTVLGVSERIPAKVMAKVNPNQTLRVSMLGPSGVGKTSILATMYDQLENVITRTDLQVRLKTEEFNILYDRLISLKRLFATDSLVPNQTQEIQANVDWQVFDFLLGRHGKSLTLQLEFIEYPLGWIEREATAQERDWVLDLLRQSDAILIPIDAPALMEFNGRWHSERNRPELVTKFIELAYENLRSPRLVIMSPIRCERYLKDLDYVTDMVEEVKKGYDRLLGYLGFGELKELIAVVVAPIQTLGEIVYHGSPKNHYSPQFAKTQRYAVYSPQDSEQPLRYLLRFAMRLHRDKRQSGYFALIRNMFKGDEYLIKAANDFAAGCKTSSPFAVLQGQEWLDLPESQL